MEASSQIIVYSGPGASVFCRETMEARLDEYYDGRFYTIKNVNSFSDIQKLDPKKDSIKALFIPGGNANLMYGHSGFDQKGVKELRDSLLTKKIPLFLSCAGAVLFSESLHFRADLTDSEPYKFYKNPSRYFSTYPLKTIAPLFPQNSPRRPEDIRVVNIKLSEPIGNLRTISCVNLMGPGLIVEKDDPDLEVLATYENLPSMEFVIGRLRIGQVFDSCIQPSAVCESVFYKQTEKRGAALFVSTHPEMTSSDVMNSREIKWSYDIVDNQDLKFEGSLKQDDDARLATLHRYFGKLDIRGKEN